MTQRFHHIICKISYLTLLMAFSIGGSSHAQSFASMRVNTQNVYKQQPIRASITVYTSTWFADAPDLGTIHIPNAFVLPFKRTQSAIQYVNNKKYATLEFFYLIFPYESGEITIPELQINISTPPEGDYIAIKRSLKTKAISIQVKDTPKSFSGTDWLVAKGVTIIEKWSKPLSDVKVGEVIERIITIKATGTLPAFIPKSNLDEESWASIYPREPQLKDTRTNKDANGIRVEKYRYLLEKEGNFTLEPITVVWYNAYLQKQYSRSTQEQTITIHSNPDLGMLTTMRDSLSTSELALPNNPNKKPFSFLGLNLKQLLLLSAILFIAIFLLLKLSKAALRKWCITKQNYLNSEKYWFDQLLNTHHKNASQQLNALYNWLIRRPNKHYTLDSFLKETNSDSVIKLLRGTFNEENQKLNKQEIRDLKKGIDYISKNKKDVLPPLNP